MWSLPVVPRDCVDVYNSGRHRNGIYTIDPDGEGAMEVFCDQVSAHVTFISESSYLYVKNDVMVSKTDQRVNPGKFRQILMLYKCQLS